MEKSRQEPEDEPGRTEEGVGQEEGEVVRLVGAVQEAQWDESVHEAGGTLSACSQSGRGCSSETGTEICREKLCLQPLK